MIEIKDLSYKYPGAEKPALKDINLQIKDGEFILITGESGSGKSTLLYTINGLIPNLFGGELTGSISVNGLVPKENPIRRLSQFVGTVFQNADSQIFMLRVEDDVAFGCENLLFPRDEIIIRRNLALKELSLWDIRERETFTLSGGQKQRLAIAGIYAMGPKIFLFDEPTTDLDEEGRRDLFQILRGLKHRGYTIILVEHQYEDFIPFADRTINFKEGQITLSLDPLPSRLNPKRKKNFHQSLPPYLKIEDLWFGYEGHPCLKGINLQIRKGESVALFGKNGSGKTTLFKAILGLLRPQKGKITIEGISNPELSPYGCKIGFLYQNPDEQLFTCSVEEEISFGPKNLGININIEEALKLFELEGYKGRQPQTLSRGERQRLALASILSMQPEIILLDEPTTGLDTKGWTKFMDITYNLTLRGKTVVFSTHNRKAMGEFADRLIQIEEGKIIRDEILR